MKDRMTPLPAWLRGVGTIALATMVATGCDDPNLPPPPAAEVVAEYYTTPAGLEVAIDGRIVEIEVTQSDRQLRRGGTLWAKMGPYIFLFTEESQRLLEDHAGVQGIRVTTRNSAGRIVTTALLDRDALTDVQWQRALNIAGRARKDGTAQMTLLEDLVDWGEEYTEFEYDTRFHH
mgnify:FL=1